MAASREKSDDRSRGVQFSKSSAKAIADTVRTVQGGDRKQPGMKGSPSVYSSGHYLAKTSAAWAKDTKQTLTIYTGDGGSETSSGETVEAWNRVANLPSGLWVVVGRANGTFYLASFDMTGLSGYSASVQQVLGHNTSGQLTWISTTPCT